MCQTHTHPFNGPFPGLPRWAGTRKVKPIWILLKRETVSGSGISWAICKSAPSSRQITTPAPHHSVFTGRMPFLLLNQQRQSTEGKHTTFCHFRRVYSLCFGLLFYLRKSALFLGVYHEQDHHWVTTVLVQAPFHWRRPTGHLHTICLRERVMLTNWNPLN